MSHVSVMAYGTIMAGFSVGLYYAGISMGWLYLWMGVMISAAVIPATLTLFWKRQNWIAAAASPVLGLICALIAWTVTCYSKFDGVLSVDTLGSDMPMLAGNVAALLSPVVFVPVLTFAFGADNYDWESMGAIKQADDVDPSAVPGKMESGDGADDDDHNVAAITVSAPEQYMAKLNRASRLAKWLTVFMAISFLVLWPMPMYGSSYVFSRRFFTGWVVVGIIWLFGSAIAVGLYPLWEGRRSMARVARGILGRAPVGSPVVQTEGRAVEPEVPNTAVPVKKE